MNIHSNVPQELRVRVVRSDDRKEENISLIQELIDFTTENHNIEISGEFKLTSKGNSFVSVFINQSSFLNIFNGEKARVTKDSNGKRVSVTLNGVEYWTIFETPSIKTVVNENLLSDKHS